MQYKVPQNIDMADKIFGPLTLIQFAELLIGGAIIYILFTSLSIAGFLIFGIPIALLTLALVFVKVQDQPFHKFLFSLFTYLISPKREVWHKVSAASPPPMPSVSKKTNEKPIVHQKLISKEELGKLAEKLNAK